jgi:hypothetical protein
MMGKNPMLAHQLKNMEITIKIVKKLVMALEKSNH